MLPGFSRASLISPATSETPSPGCTMRTFGVAANTVIGVKSFTGSYGSFLKALELMPCVLIVAIRSV